jgi:REP element-mobilizing transposase RayT/CheY-like chemotaxis protein
MTLVPTRVLIINRQVSFSIKLKQALEQAGGFDVTAFTTPDTALDYLKTRPQDVILLDFDLGPFHGADVVHQARAVQPEIAIVASPNTIEVNDLARDLRLQGVIDMPIAARKLMPMLRRAADSLKDMLPDTAEAPAMPGDTDTLHISPPPGRPPTGVPEFSSLDSVLTRVGGFDDQVGTDTIDVDMSDAAYGEARARALEIVMGGDEALRDQLEKGATRPLDQAATEAISIFQQLAAEEPPMPSLEESGTVGDLMIGVGDTNLREVMQLLRRTEAAEPSPPALLPGETIPAHDILIKALDETAPFTQSLEDLRESIERGIGTGALAPVDTERYIREPDFLTETMELDQTGKDASIQTTRLTHPEDLFPDPGDMQTETIDPEARFRPSPPASLPEMRPPAPRPADRSVPLPLENAETGPLDAVEEAEFSTDFGPPVQPIAPSRPQTPVVVTADSDDPYMAQLALSLTQVSLELTAECTLLTHGGRIIARAGTMPAEDVEEIGATIEGDWDAAGDDARIRFVTLQSSGKDYMLYSRHSAGGYTLTMIFAGNMRLSVIRRQSDRLAEALNAVPEPQAEPQSAELDDAPEIAGDELLAQASMTAAPVTALTYTGTTTTYAYVWLVRDPDQVLTDAMARAVISGLEDQLSQMGWRVESLRVHEDYVYLLAEIPGEVPANEIVDDLKRRSSELVYSVNPQLDRELLWADSYYALFPGRDLTVDEIQNFISFAR